MDIRRGAGHYFGQASDSALDSRGRGAAYLDRSALRRLLELETKRCRGDCPQLFRTRFSFWLSADRLGRRVRGVRGNRVSHSTFSRGDLLQICRYSRMDWSQPVRDFLRYLSPIFLFARARDLLRHCCDLGYVFLRFFATEHLCRALLHAGCAIAQPGNHRIVFFSALGSRSQNRAVLSGCDYDFLVHPDQDHEHRDCRADFVSACSRGRRPRLCSSSLRSGQPRSTPAATAGSLCRDRRLTFGRVVLACASNRRKILSVSFLWCRWSSTGKFFVVLGYRATNCDVESDTGSRNPSANRFVRSAAGKIRLPL